jgi:hypothetical protein
MKHDSLSVLLLSGLTIISACPTAAQQPPFLPEGTSTENQGGSGAEGVRADENVLIATRISSPITLDGISDEDAWQSVEPLPAEMHAPNYGAKPSQRTEFRVAHDGEHLYYSCQSYDSNPELIQDFSLERDQIGWDSDNCGIFLDTLNDGENALLFMTWPSGNRTDFALANDAQGRLNTNWDSFWDVAVARNERGWFAEFRIPFSSLLFQAEGDRVVMGLATVRNLSRNNERISYPNATPGFGSFSFARPSQMGKLIIEEDLASSTPVYVTPYTLVGTGYSHALNPAEASYDREVQRVVEAGVDLKYSLTSNFTLDLTYNTDFAQVEADDQVVNLTRFSLFFPEKRRFFQERASNFEYSLGGEERLFHTRRIGLAQGEPVPIYGGARLVGRLGEWDLGVLNMQTEPSEFLPSENQGVVRLRRRVANANSYLGGILTSRVGSGGRYNIVYGADALLRVVGNDYVTLNLAQSLDHGEEIAAAAEPIGAIDRALVRLNWERRGTDDLAYSLELTRAGEFFEPGMGFLQRRDYTKGQAAAGYGWRPGPDSPLLTYAVNVDGTVFSRNEDQTVETGEVALSGTVETKRSDRFTATVPLRYEDLLRPFSLPDGTPLPEGTYRFATVRLNYRAPQAYAFRPAVTLEGGRFFDGRQLSLSFDPTWSPSRHLRLQATYRLDHLAFPNLDHNLTAHLGRLRTEVMYSNRTSFLGLVQYNSADRNLLLNFRLRYNPREGNDLYLVWNEGLITEGVELDGVRPLSDRRSITLKYSRTLPFGL